MEFLFNEGVAMKMLSGIAVETINFHFTVIEYLINWNIDSQSCHGEEECDHHKSISTRQSYDQWC